MNLLNDPWIPIQRQNGDLENIAPWQIAETYNPVMKLASPRHDFDGVLIQFLIGLLQTVCMPVDHDSWVDWLENVPDVEELKLKFEVFKEAFEVDGDGPRFMQDLEEFDGEPKPISGLLLEAPGNRTSTLFLDHFVKGGLYSGLCPCCAVSALFALQTNAPSGGAGHRTSLRGGGPLTSLIIPDTQAKNSLPDTLWTLLWLNVLDEQSLSRLSGNSELNEKQNIFPWLANTLTSEVKTGVATSPEQAHALQMYWAMPRRIRIDWQSEKFGTCDLCGTKNQLLITNYITKNYGPNYIGGWQHPLSPHYEEKKTNALLPMHAQPGGLAYRYWLAWTGGGGQYLPAKIVSMYMSGQERHLDGEQIRLWVFGYDMDNMKARCWYEKQYPLFVIEDEKQRMDFSQRVSAMIDLASQIASFVQSCVKEAWFDRPADARGDTSFLKEAFFEQTESQFLIQLNELRASVAVGETRSILQQWHEQLAHHAMRLFDHWVAKGDVAFDDPRRISEAHRKLRNLIHGKKMMQKLGISKNKEKAV